MLDCANDIGDLARIIVDKATFGVGRGFIPVIALLLLSLNASDLSGAIATLLISSIMIARGALGTALALNWRVPMMFCGVGISAGAATGTSSTSFL